MMHSLISKLSNGFLDFEAPWFDNKYENDIIVPSKCHISKDFEP